MADSTDAVPAPATTTADTTAQQETPASSTSAAAPADPPAQPSKAADPPTSSSTKPSKPKAKKKRRLPRGRRAEDMSDEEGGGPAAGADADGDASDISSEDDASDLSSGSESDEEDEGEPPASASASAPAAGKDAPGKPTTAWADVTDALDGGVDDSAPVVSFDELERNGLAAVTATASAGKAGKAKTQQGKATADGEVDPVKAAKALEKRQRQKEKRKAKAVARKQQQQQAAPADAAAPSPAPAADDQPTASTSKVEDTIPAEPSPPPSATTPTGPNRVSNRQAYLAKISSDPSFVPRVGRFWTHDERHYAAGKFGQGDSEYSGLREMSDYWRGRGFRGRARGFPARGVPGFRGRGGMPFHPQQLQQQQQQQERQAPPHQPDVAPTPAEAAETATSPPPVDDPNGTGATSPAPVKVSVPTFGKGKWGAGDKSDADKDWNHDGYLALMQDEERRSARGRGRGRGQQRGMAIRGRGAARGGVPFIHPAQAQAQQMQADPSEVVVRLPQSATTAEELSVPAVSETASAVPPAALPLNPSDPSATSASTPAISTGAPAPSAAQPSSAPPDSADAAPVKTPTSADISSLQLQAEYAALRQQQELVRQKELRLQEDMRRLELEQQRMRGLPTYAGGPGSEAGSIGSGSQSMGGQPVPAPAQGNMLPPGVGMAENGSFFDMATGQPVVFVPTPSPGPSGPVNGYQGNRPYFPPQQSYYPGAGPMTPDYAQPRQIQHRASQSGSFYPPAPSYGSQSSLGGRESPYPPPQAGPGGYFALPRQNSRIQIRAPSGTSEELAGSVLKNKSLDRKQSGGPAAGASPYPVNGAVQYQEYGYGAPVQGYPQGAQQYPAQGQQYGYGGDYGYQQQYGGY